jgi:hypothetical protein
MPLSADITIVTGLPRSGTSLMMQMLDRGGIAVVTDHIRTADADNPRGYYELEQVKQIERDASWLPATRGKAFKMISYLLFHLPVTERYRLIFMERDLDEMLVSQEKMIERLGRPQPPPRVELKRSFNLHLTHLNRWLLQQPHMSVLRMPYRDLIADPSVHAARVADFLDGYAHVEKMLAAIDPALYRNKVAVAPLA